MKVCLIPPRGLEHLALEGNMQMALAIADYMTNPKLMRTLSTARDRGDHIILDNGAAELNTAAPSPHMMICGKAVNAHEIVLPDVLGDQAMTMKAVDRFLEEIPQVETYHDLMAVTQGVNMREIKQLVGCFASMPQIKVLGIPRLLMGILGTAARIDIANMIEHAHPGRFQIHLLGANPLWPVEIRHAAKYASHIRSVDTSLPFNYALAGVSLRGNAPQIVYRTPDYFTSAKKPQEGLVLDNIKVIMEWARGETASRS